MRKTKKHILYTSKEKQRCGHVTFLCRRANPPWIIYYHQFICSHKLTLYLKQRWCTDNALRTLVLHTVNGINECKIMNINFFFFFPLLIVYCMSGHLVEGINFILFKHSIVWKVTWWITQYGVLHTCPKPVLSGNSVALTHFFFFFFGIMFWQTISAMGSKWQTCLHFWDSDKDLLVYFIFGTS